MDNLRCALGRDNSENLNLTIMDYTGRIVLSENYSAGELSNKVFNLSNYSKGVYFLEIRNENFNVLEKIVVK